MGQSEILKILKDHYPEWLDYKAIQDLSTTSRRTTMRNLNSIKRRSEVELKIKESLFDKGGSSSLNGLKTYYRHKEDR